jgi:hypothetical protein
MGTRYWFVLRLRYATRPHPVRGGPERPAEPLAYFGLRLLDAGEGGARTRPGGAGASDET